MAIAADISRDVALTNKAITLFKNNYFWLQVFRKAMNVGDIATVYPRYDKTAFTEIDDRNKFKKGRNSIPRKVDYKHEDEHIVIQGYEAMSQKSDIEIKSLQAMKFKDIINSMLRMLIRKVNNFVDWDLIDLITNTSAWTNYNVTTATADGFTGKAWTDQTDGDPENDLRVARRKIINATNGDFAPNTLIMNTEGMDTLFTHPKIKNRYDNISGDADQKKKWLFDMLGIPSNRVFECKKIKNTMRKGAAAKSNSAAMGAYVWLGYIDPNGSIDVPSALAALVPYDYAGNEYGVVVDKQINMTNGNRFQDGFKGVKVFVDQFTQVKQLCSEMGVLLTGIYS